MALTENNILRKFIKFKNQKIANSELEEHIDRGRYERNEGISNTP